MRAWAASSLMASSTIGFDNISWKKIKNNRTNFRGISSGDLHNVQFSGLPGG